MRLGVFDVSSIATENGLEKTPGVRRKNAASFSRGTFAYLTSK